MTVDRAWAQLALPGATAPAPIGSVANRPAPKKPRAKVPKPLSPVGSPAETGLGGKTFSLNGGKSQIAFTPRDKTVDVSRLMLEGTKLSKPLEACQVDVQSMPLTLEPAGKVNGLNRFAVPLPVCPMSFDVLDGAILVTSQTAVCVFKEADCQITPSGLWGPAPGDIGPDQAKTIERERRRSEENVRTAYKGLVSSTKDRALIRGFAKDQAGFSSHREEVCRDYIGESRHGFCASRLTQARAMELQTAYTAAAAEKEKRKQEKEKKHKK